MRRFTSVSDCRAGWIVRFLGLLGLFVLAATSRLTAAVHLVPSEYAAIQTAVDAAAPGDTVFVAAGVYPEAVVITGKYLRLSGTASGDVTIDATALTAPCVTIVGPAPGQTVISGLTLAGANCDDGALFITNAASVLVDSCCVTDNRVYKIERGPISVASGSAVHVRGCHVAGNLGYTSGGVAAVQSSLWLDGNLIQDNGAEGVGAVYIRDCSTDMRHNTIIDNNRAPLGTPYYAVLTDYGVSFTMVDNIVAFNAGVGVVLRRAITFAIEYNDVFGNTAGDYGAETWTVDPGASPTNISADPQLVAPDFLPTVGSTVVGTGSEGGDIGLEAAVAGCSRNIETAVCGNGILEFGEQCDDGNTTPGDGCSANCFNECPIVLTGDVNLTGDINAADVIYLVNYVFKSGPLPLPCKAAGDVNCSGTVTSADVIGVLNYIFNNAIPPCDGCTSPLAKSCDWPG